MSPFGSGRPVRPCACCESWRGPAAPRASWPQPSGENNFPCAARIPRGTNSFRFQVLHGVATAARCGQPVPRRTDHNKDATGRDLVQPERKFIMANIGTFTAEKDGFTGTASHPDAQRQGQAGSQRQGRERKRPRLPPASGRPRRRRGVEENQRGRAGLPVGDPRRSFVPGDGLCPPDRRRGRHARPDLVAQQAQGGLTAAYRAPPTGGARCLIAASLRPDFGSCLSCLRHVKSAALHCPWSPGSNPGSMNSWRVGACAPPRFRSCPMPRGVHVRPASIPHAFRLGGALAPLQARTDAPRLVALFQLGLESGGAPGQQFVGLARDRRFGMYSQRQCNSGCINTTLSFCIGFSGRAPAYSYG